MKRKNENKYKHLTRFFLGLILAIILSQYQPFHDFLIHLGGVGYLGAALAGMMYVLSFTMPVGILILTDLAEELPIIPLSLVAAIGGMIGDFVIFKYFKDDLAKEVRELYKQYGGHTFSKIFSNKYFRWSLPIIGAIIIASPFPDELGVGLMGISRMKSLHFIVLSFVLDFIGVFILVSIAASLKQ